MLYNQHPVNGANMLCVSGFQWSSWDRLTPDGIRVSDEQFVEVLNY